MKKPRFEDGDYIFDGFAHRGFDAKHDGWRNELPDVNDYPSVTHAQDTLAMFQELCEARKRIWELKQELKLWKPPL